MPEYIDPARPANWAEEVAEVHHLLSTVHTPYLRYVWEVTTQEGVASYAIEIQMTPKSKPATGEFASTPLQAYHALLRTLGHGAPTAAETPAAPA